MMEELQQPSITIIGTGAVGTALLNFFRKEAFVIQSLWNSHSGLVLNETHGNLEPVGRSLPQKPGEIGTFIFITVPDDRISVVSQSLADCPVDWHGKHIVHCSGNLTSDECAALAMKGAKTVSMHPVQTFQKGDSADRFNKITISIEGNQQLVSELVPWIEKMGANPLKLSKDQKRALHIAAVFVSNYFVALLHKTEVYLESEGMNQGLKVLEPLINQTLSNIMQKGAVDALTGPVSRGDVSSVQKHLDALKNREDLEVLYKMLGEEAVGITKKRGEVPELLIEELERIFITY